MSSEWRLVTFPVIAESRMADGTMGNKKKMGRGGSGVWGSERMGLWVKLVGKQNVDIAMRNREVAMA